VPSSSRAGEGARERGSGSIRRDLNSDARPALREPLYIKAAAYGLGTFSHRHQAKAGSRLAGFDHALGSRIRFLSSLHGSDPRASEDYGNPSAAAARDNRLVAARGVGERAFYRLGALPSGQDSEAVP